ncbi:MAG: dialkylresorcinol condensing enzyme [Neisseria sp.]|nr:dialkylresorcinol condensing enzyme [Neisseria sp.]
MKRVLLVYYSQTGQLAELTRHFALPLHSADGIEVETLCIQPQQEFAFPWRFFTFFNTFPETVHLQPRPIVEPAFQTERYDAIVLAYTVWFLSPAQPMTAFLQHPEAQKRLRDTPVITLIGCRNMWLQAQETMKKMLADCGAKLVGNVVKIDECSSAASFITTPAWMFTGKKQAFACLPSAGIAEHELRDAQRFGERLKQVLQNNQTLDETLFHNMGAVRVNEKLIFSEKAGKRSFDVWGKLLLAAGKRSAALRRVLLVGYIVFLVGIILTLVPISAAIKILLKPWLKDKIAAEKAYFAAPSGE